MTFHIFREAFQEQNRTDLYEDYAHIFDSLDKDFIEAMNDSVIWYVSKYKTEKRGVTLKTNQDGHIS